MAGVTAALVEWITGVVLLKIALMQCLFGIRSMRQTMKEIETNAAYRWFIGYDFS